MADIESAAEVPAKKRKSGIPTGNAGEYYVMGELLRRGFDAQLADRNTKGYDLVVGRIEDKALKKAQVKTVRAAPWYVSRSHFSGELLDQTTIYVLLGKEGSKNPVRYYIAKNRDLADQVHFPSGWEQSGFVSGKAVAAHEDMWDVLLA